MHTDPYLKEAADGEVLVRVDGVGKKFCRSLKKSLWYGVCDIASELNPFVRKELNRGKQKNLTTERTEDTEVCAEVRLGGQAGAEFSNPSASGLARDSENTSLIRAANNLRSSGDQTGSVSASAKIGEICGKNAEGLRDGEFWAVQDVSFELRRGECLGLIGHNGAGNQAAGQLLGRLPKAARRVRRRGKARINTTLLKMLNGLIKPDAGSITMRGRVGALIALGAGFNPILTGRENIYINGSELGLKKRNRNAGRRGGRVPQAGPEGFAIREKREPNRRQDR
jgi:ABC-type glutathione transport system ATPase component